jgi:hypothetical protein
VTLRRGARLYWGIGALRLSRRVLYKDASLPAARNRLTQRRTR